MHPCSFCDESCGITAEIHGTGLHVCDGCVVELAEWAAEHTATVEAHLRASCALPWDGAFNPTSSLPLERADHGVAA